MSVASARQALACGVSLRVNHELKATRIIVRSIRKVSWLLGLGLPLALSLPCRAEGADRLGTTAGPRESLRALVEAARTRAPEVLAANASLTASHAAFEGARMLPLGNPYLEITAERGGRNVTQDLAINGALWLPLELSGQVQGRAQEARGIVAFHAALVGQDRADAAARLVQAYGIAVVATERGSVLAELLASAREQAALVTERVVQGDALQRDASLAAVEVARHEMLIAETRATLARSLGELSELVGHELHEPLGAAEPPSLPSRPVAAKVRQSPRSLLLAAEARLHAATAERWRHEGSSSLSVGVVAGRGDFGESRLGGGLAYAFPVFRANRPERARAAADASRALAEKYLHESVATGRLRVLHQEQQELTHATSALTEAALPAARAAVDAAQATYAAGKLELLAVLVSRRELANLSLKRLDLFEESWLLVRDYVKITGELP